MLHRTHVQLSSLHSIARGLGKIAYASFPRVGAACNILNSCAAHNHRLPHTSARTAPHAAGDATRRARTAHGSSGGALAARSYMKEAASSLLAGPSRSDGAVASASCASVVSSALRRCPRPRPLSPELVESLSHKRYVNHKEFQFQTVPSTRTARAANFTSLFVQLGWDKLRARGGGAGPSEGGFLSLRSHERIAQTLCRMRGAVLKLGQMVSIQDARTLPPAVVKLFERARDGAYAMPFAQLEKTLAHEWKEPHWRRAYFAEFSPSPAAAASIGQVHYAVLLSPMSETEVAAKAATAPTALGEEGEANTTAVGVVDRVHTSSASNQANAFADASAAAPSPQVNPTPSNPAGMCDKDGGVVEVAVKVQYPGVARSIDADVANLRTLMSLGVAPAGMFVDTILTELQQELKRECRYTLEAAHQTRYRALLLADPSLSELFHVPMVVPHLSTDAVLTTEYVRGVPLDQLAPSFSPPSSRSDDTKARASASSTPTPTRPAQLLGRKAHATHLDRALFVALHANRSQLCQLSLRRRTESGAPA